MGNYCTCQSKPQEILESKSHTFKTKVFKQPFTCAVCKESIWNEGRICKVCKYACHTKCEYKVATGCSPPVNYELKQGSGPKRNSMSVQTDTVPPVTPPRGKDSYIMASLDLDVDYITERIISMSFPAGGLESQYQANLKDVVHMLQRKHGNNYLFFNLSRRRHDINKLNMQVVDIGWPDQLAPPLEKLCSICKQIETWLKADASHVVVIHCKGGRGPIGVVVSAYMGYLNFSNSTDTALDRYAMRRFLDAKTGSAMHPSQHRYIEYFSGLLTRSIQINNSPLFLHYVFIHGVPNFDTAGGCRPFMRIYQNMQTVFTSGVYTVSEGTTRFAIPFDQALPLKGDILVKCYHKKFRSTTRDVIFRVQFHTTAVMEYRLVFKKPDLDDACTDPRFTTFSKVEFIFSATPDKIHNSDYVRGSSFPVENSNDPLIRWDSYEHFDSIIEGGDDVVDANMNATEIPHLSAPDGSLYAQVCKNNVPKTEQVNNSASTPVVNGPVQVNGPLQPNGVATKSASPHPKLPVAAITSTPLGSSPKRGPSYKERQELDELLKGFDDLLDGIDLKETPDAGDFVSVHRQISQSQKADAAKPNPVPHVAAHISPTSPSRDSGYSRSSTEIENPYAEIHDKDKQGNKKQKESPVGGMHNPLYGEPMMRNNSNHHTNHMYHSEQSSSSQSVLNGQPVPNGQLLTLGQGMSNGPVEEKIEAELQSNAYSANSHAGTHSPLRYNANERLSNHRQGREDNRHYRSSSPLPHTSNDSHVLPNSTQTENQRGNISPGSPTRVNSYPNQVQSPTSPIRAQKEIIKIVHTGPTPSNLGSPLNDRQHQPSQLSPTPSETSSEGSTDGLTWLQRQQLKLKQKRDRERQSQGSTSHPLYIDTMMGNRLGHQTPPLSSLSPRSDSYNRVNDISSRYTSPPVSSGCVFPNDIDQRSPSIQDSKGIGQHKDTPDPRVKRQVLLHDSPRMSDPIIATKVTRPLYQPSSPNQYPQYVPPPEAHHSPPQRDNSSNRVSEPSCEPKRLPMTHSRPLDLDSQSSQSYVVDPSVVSRPPRSPRKERVFSNPVNEKRMHQIERAPSVDEPDAKAGEPVQEPVIKQGTVASRVADARARINELERSMSPPALERQPRSLHRSNSAAGYENGSPSLRSRTPSPEVWMRNPGGQPQQETYYWNRVEGLKSPEIEARREKERLIEYGPGFETPPNTPSFPLDPRTPYVNLVSTPTPLAFVGRGPEDKEVQYIPQHHSLKQTTPQQNTPQKYTQQSHTPQQSHHTPQQSHTPQQNSQFITPHKQILQQDTLQHIIQQHDTPQLYTKQQDTPQQNSPQQYYSQQNTPQQNSPQQYQQEIPQQNSSQQYNSQQNTPPQFIKEQDTPQEKLGQQYTPQQSTPQTTQDQQLEMSPSKMNAPNTTEVTVYRTVERNYVPPKASHQTHHSQDAHRQHSPEQKSVHFDIDDFFETRLSQDVSPKSIANEENGRKEIEKEPQISPVHEKIEKSRVRFVEEGSPKKYQDENRNEHNMKDLTLLDSDRTIIPTNQHQVEVQVHHTPPPRDQPPTRVAEMPHSLPFGVPSTGPYPQYTIYTGPSTTTHNGQASPSGSHDVSPTAPFASVDLPPRNYYPTFSDRKRSKAAAGKPSNHKALPESEQPSSLQGEVDMSGYRTVYDNRGKHAKPGSPASVRSGSSVNDSGRTTPSNFYLNEQPSLSSSQTSLAEPGVENVRFVKDLSSWWYKPHITRDDAISMLKDKQPGTFVVRDSNSFPGAFGLAVKVATPPPNAPQQRKAGDPVSELVRHFLIEPNSRGVKLKGCQNEPIFGSLSALVYQHTMKQLALPCKLVLPETDPANVPGSGNDANSRANLLAKGAACNVLYLHSFDMESLTGSSAVSEATNRLTELSTKPPSIIVHFKVSSKGITVTDNNRKLFFRRHYPVDSVLFCGSDSGSRRWQRDESSKEADARIFGFVSRKPGSITDNVCHLFAEYEKEQPASAIVSFVTKVLIGQASNTSVKSP